MRNGGYLRTDLKLGQNSKHQNSVFFEFYISEFCPTFKSVSGNPISYYFSILAKVVKNYLNERIKRVSINIKFSANFFSVTSSYGLTGICVIAIKNF